LSPAGGTGRDRGCKMEWLERNRGNLAAALVVLVAVAAALLLQLPRRPALEVTLPSTPAGPPAIKVHVAGAVAAPGVYQLEMDARVEDALRVAGGPSPSADLSTLNLATPLRDGQQVVIPQIRADVSPGVSLSSASPGNSPPAPAGKLNLNAASGKELEALPGIGQVTAQKILDYRAQYGAIVSLEELRDAKVITASMYDKIRDLVEVR
jgi:competence protein ComEA